MSQREELTQGSCATICPSAEESSVHQEFLRSYSVILLYPRHIFGVVSFYPHFKLMFYCRQEPWSCRASWRAERRTQQTAAPPPWAPTTSLAATKIKMMCQKLGHEDAPSTSRSAPCGSPHLLTRAWRTGLASTSTCTLKGYSVDASPSLTCFHGTVAPSKSPCWSPAIALSGRRPVRCSSWSRHTWEIDLLVWTAATVPYSSSLSAGTCQVCGMSSTCSW